MSVHELTSGPLALAVDTRGGAVRRFRHLGHQGDEDILRPWVGDDVLHSAAYPLVPFSGRVADARFSWEGEVVELPRNFPPEPHSIHGTGWEAEWAVEAHGPASLTLSHTPDPARWPWRFTATQTFALDAAGLSWRMAVTNDDSRDMPAGLGWHPFFVRGGAELSVEVGDMWANGADGVSAARVAPPPGLARGRAVDTLDLDNAFDWEAGTARLAWPQEGRALDIRAGETLRNLVIYAPPGADFVCVEPVSHVPDALNAGWEGHGGMVRLAPGDTLEGSVRLTLS